MMCANCLAIVPKIYTGSDGQMYCCAACLFYPLGCRCKYGEFGIVEDRDYYADEDFDEDFCDE